ncbi:hypothetical protein K8089_08095 [Aequorivita sp. F47161]|uniref:DUF4870 domain-containing protein n=1 Tax=Aequorivita vitellina TaxID=2874475 RepID=A0A9X1U374_9FLAO|nr:hypothetical protein [Aequorivita vitellina]MCG2418982.1 hypothetical protein [Aequorivita vitellina]
MKTSPPGKSSALIAYAPFVGFLIAYFINRDNNHEFATWHIKNMFGLFLLFIVSMVVQTQIDFTAGDALWFISFIFWVYSWVMAFLNQRRGIPYLSEKFQEWFTFLS